MVNPEVINRIKEQADIVTVIGHYLKIELKGANYMAVCPFHDDTRPSLSISPSKQIFKCFVCGTSGNCFSFIQKYEKVSFIEAVKKVVEICNIDAPELKDEVPSKPRANAEVYKAIKDLAGFYHFSLRQPEGKEAYEYLKERFMNDDVIDHFQIGYAPSDAKRAITLLTNKLEHSTDTLQKAGILGSGGLYDRYQERIMFPLENTKGDLVGFSGRIYRPDQKGESKYINSPETTIFHKSDILYNYRNARETCRKEGYLYVLEGFMDVIALYKAGVKSAVALMGTALTSDHIELFKSLNVEIRLCLDSDNAGQLASYNSSKLLTKAGIKYKIVKPIDDGKDPDEYLNANGPEGLIKALNHLLEPVLFEATYLLKSNQLSTLELKEAFIKSRIKVLSRYGELVRSELIVQLSKILSLNEEAVQRFYRIEPKPVAEPVLEREKEKPSINPRTVSSTALNDYIKSLLQDQNAKSMVYQRLTSLESGLISKMAEHQEAYGLFDQSNSYFIVPLYNKLNMALCEYYQKTHKTDLDIEDYQSIIDEFELSNDEDKDDIIALLERIKICKSTLYEKSSFIETLSNHRELYQIYISSEVKKDPKSFEQVMRKKLDKKNKSREN